MINITKTELQKLVRHDARRITESKQRVIGKHRPQPHRPRMQYAFVAKIAK
jgi:hypothetical protein